MRIQWTTTPEGDRTRIPLPDMIGFISMMLDDEDSRDAKTQLHEGYAHGGGWYPMSGFTLDNADGLTYPGDPTMYPWATAKLRDERILCYPHAWFCVVQPDGSYEVARMD